MLDEYALMSGLRSRSAAVQHAIRLLQHASLGSDYATAWADWASTNDQPAWEGTIGDGLNDAPRRDSTDWSRPRRRERSGQAPAGDRRKQRPGQCDSSASRPGRGR